MGDRERHIAIREAEQIHSSTEYFDARPHLTSMESRRVFDAGFVRGFDAATERLRAAQPAVPSLSVVYGPMPETNGKSNFTAILCRDGNVVDGFTIARSEYPDRVRYDAACVQFIIGELSERPNLLDYDGDKHSGYVDQPAQPAVPDKMREEDVDTKQENFPGAFVRGWNACRRAMLAASQRNNTNETGE